ncbi:myotubularin-related protein 2 [Episyrphus balteatus]|uniref:myotubularin-related protein 2 n=1 Tax=Episyrphus balteatus TaxID=286459 RepID=UPI0024856709|nr:myotubularin-related protein 2 [Episyrphus balteatus]
MEASNNESFNDSKFSRKNASSDSLDFDHKAISARIKSTLENENGQMERGTPFTYLIGEQDLDQRNDVRYMCPYTGPLFGVLIITNYRLFFRSLPQREAHQIVIVDVPLGTISRVEKIGGSTSRRENAYGIEISCKDSRTIRFAHKQQNHSRRSVFEKITSYAFPLSFSGKIFAFNYTERFGQNGWDIYDSVAEYSRLGVPNELWRISKVNANYAVSDSYPAVWAVPSCASDELLKKVGVFRSKGRIPILSWIHPKTNVSITRCSQPLVGVGGKRCPEDESYLNYILEMNSNSDKLVIMDARPSANAIANKAKGGGYESDEIYRNVEFHFLDIHNIHVMRESLKKLKEVCYPLVDDQKWLSSIDNTLWLKHLKFILAGAVRIVEKVDALRVSVLVHCSDGWDRTSQLTALSMLLLDPFYRTLRGFEILIEKEWLSFGHKFQQRIGHGDGKHSDAERSPVFLQFIDCVWQVMQQFPNVMEFNEHFLITILDHLFSCRFGTFLCNNEAERLKEDLKNKTCSLWSYINASPEQYRNPFYNSNNTGNVLKPIASMRCVKLWKGYYCRWNPGGHAQANIYQRTKDLMALQEQLQKQVNEERAIAFLRPVHQLKQMLKVKH